MNDVLPISEWNSQIARDLQAREVHGKETSGAGAEFNVLEKLRRPLLLLTGKAGFTALLSRSLALATRDCAPLQRVKVDDGGFLLYIDTASPLNEKERLDGGVALIGHLLTLLHTFLGEALMLRILQDLWSDVSFRRGTPNRRDTAR